MKKIINKMNMFIIAMMVSGSAIAAPAKLVGVNESALCELIRQMGGIFSTLRILAFAGAAFTIAGWAWGYIQGGKGVDIDDVRKKGTGLLVGFILLFTIGAVLSVFMSQAGQGAMGCEAAFNQW